MGVMYIGGNKVIPIFKETQIVPYPAYGVTINNPDTEHQEVVAKLEPCWKTSEYDESFIAGGENVGVKLHLYINTTATGYAHGQLSWTPNTFVNGGEMDGSITVTATAATPIEDVVIPTGYEDYYLKNNISNFYNDTNYDSYKSRTQLSGKVIVFDLNNWLPSQTSVNMSSMFQDCTNIIELDLSNLNTSKNTSMQQIFRGCTKLTSLDLSNWDTSNVTTFHQAFWNCNSLESLDATNWDTSKVTTFQQAFNGCNSLTSLDLNNWNMSNVTNMQQMFQSCFVLNSLNISNWDTSNVTTFEAMFNDCKELTSLDVNNWNTSKVTSMLGMFQNMPKMKNFNVTNWDTSKVTNMYQMFALNTITSLDLSNWNTSNVTTMNSMFSGCSSLKILDLSNFDTTKVTNMSSMFSNCPLQYLIIDSNTFKFQAKTSMSNMYLPNTCKILVPQALISTYQSATNWSTYANNFEAIENYNIVRTNGEVLVLPASLNDYYLKNNVTDFYEDKNYTTSVTRTSLTGDVIVFDLDNYLPSQSSIGFGRMFDDCSTLTSVDLSHLDTSKVTSFNSMFWRCPSLTSVNISNFNTSNVTNMNQLFSGCQSLTSVDVSNWDTSKVTTLSSMFQGCQSLTSVNVSNWDTSKNTDLNSTFWYCSSLTSLDLSNWDTSKVTDMYCTFQFCSSLKVLDLSNWDTSSVNRMYGMFYNLTNLEYLIIGSDTFKFTLLESQSLPSNCKILVPQALISTYQSANYWSEHASKFEAIENYNIVRTHGQVIIVDSNIEDYYLKNNISNFYTDPTYSSYVSRSSLTGDIVVFDLDDYLPSQTSVGMNNMFNSCSSLTSLDLSHLDTSKVNNMGSMFQGCSSLKYLDVSNFDTSNVTDMQYMFYGCTSLTSLDLSNFDTSKVTSYMFYMMYSCNKLITVDVSNFDTSNVTNMSSMFSSITKFIIIDSPTLKFQAKSSPSSMGISSTCKILVPQALISTYQSATNWSTIASQFDAIENYTITRSNGEVTVSKSIDLSSYVNIDDNYNLENYYANDNSIVTAEFTNLETVNGREVMKSMFVNCDGLKTVSFPKLRSIDGYCAMQNMFQGCDNLQNISFPELLTINNTSDSLALYYGFYNSKSSLLNVSFPKLTTVGNQGLNSCFYTCTNLTTAPSFPSLTSIGTSGLYYCFYNCTSLTTAPTFANLSTIETQGLQYCFQNCTSLTTAPTFASLTSIGNNGLYQCFSGCTSLTGSISFDNLTTIGSQGFYYCFQNTKITSLSFPLLTADSFGSSTNCFDYMLYGVTGCTVHFPAILQSVIGNWTGVRNGMKGTNTTVLFDLNPATINFTNSSNATLYLNGELVVNNTTSAYGTKPYTGWLSSSHTLLLDKVTNLQPNETRNVTVNMSQQSVKLSLSTNISGVSVKFIKDGVEFDANDEGNNTYSINLIGNSTDTIKYKITKSGYYTIAKIINIPTTNTVISETLVVQTIYYDVVGNVTIENNIASGFSETDYLTSTLENIPTTNIDLIIKSNLPSYPLNPTQTDNYQIMAGCVNSKAQFGKTINGSSQGVYRYNNTHDYVTSTNVIGISWFLYRQTSSGFSCYRLNDNNETYTLDTLPDISNWILLTSTSYNDLFVNGEFIMGRNPDSSYTYQYWTGSLYLNDICIRDSLTKEIYWKPVTSAS